MNNKVKMGIRVDADTEGAIDFALGQLDVLAMMVGMQGTHRWTKPQVVDRGQGMAQVEVVVALGQHALDTHTEDMGGLVAAVLTGARTSVVELEARQLLPFCQGGLL